MEKPAVVLSPSQIKQWLPSAQGCNRKWGFKYLLHIKEPEKKGTATGTRAHRQTEHYLKGEALDYSTPVMRDAAEIAIPGFVNLPPPLSPGMLVEEPFRFETASGIVYRGVLDVEVADSKVIPGCDGGMPGIIDHKSTKSARYIKTVAELESDEQSNMYAYAMMAKYESPVVDVVYNYIFTEGTRRTTRVHLKMHSPRVAQEFDRIHAVGREIAATYALQPKVLDLPPNLSACDAFGGCPYRGLCTDLHSGPLGHLTAEEASSQKDFPMTQSGIDLFTSLETLNAKEAMPAAFLSSPAASMFPPPMPTVPINPPECGLPVPVVEAAAVVEKPKRTRRTKAQMAADAESPIARQMRYAAEDAATQDTYAADTKTIPSPPPDDIEFSRAADTIPAPAAEDLEAALDFARTPEVVAYHRGVATIPAPAPAGFTLYLDCAPEGLPVCRAYNLYQRVNEEIQKTYGVSNFQLVKYEGPGLFLVGFLKLFDESPRDIVVDTRTKEGLLVVDALRARASVVVR